MRIFVTGTKGIPNIPGGIETHCRELYPRIAEHGHEVVISVRSAYSPRSLTCFKGVKLIRCFSPKGKHAEAIVHTFFSILAAKKYCPDILHIHAIGPSLLTPLAGLMGFTVVTTHHGPDYKRQKWGLFAKVALRFGELLGSIFSKELIAVSATTQTLIKKKYARKATLIYNGVSPPSYNFQQDFLDHIGVTPKNYILAVARLVPEKGIPDLIRAFSEIDTEMNLVIAGDFDHDCSYNDKLRQIVAKDARVIMTGYVIGEPLAQLFSNARLFVLPSHHEGLPIVLLEALSYGLPTLVSDIDPNREIGLFPHWYFKCGDIADLKSNLTNLLSYNITDMQRRCIRELLIEKFNWDTLSEQTLKVYEKALSSPD